MLCCTCACTCVCPCVLYRLLCSICSVQRAQKISNHYNNILCSVLCPQYGVICTLWSLPCALYRVRCTVCSLPGTLYSMLCTVYSVLCALYRDICTMCSVPLHCTPSSMPCALHHMLYKHYNTILCSVTCAQYGVICTLCFVPFALYHVHYTM